MKKIDDLKLQMYVDNELSKEESIEVENYLKIDNEARSLVENYKKINHLISSTYSQIKSDDLPKRTLDLLMDEKPSFFNKLFNYEVKLFPTLGSVAALAIVAIMGINVFKIDNNPTNPTNLMSENSRHVVLNELQNILKDSEDNLSGIVSFKNKNIEPSFLNKLFNYEVKLFPTLGSVAALAIVAIMGINVFKIDNNPTNPTNLMSENSRHVVLNELQNILKDSEDNLSGIVSFKNKNIEYKEVKSYLDARGRPCKDIKFENFSIKDAKINEATFVKLSSGEWKVIKLEFIKDSSVGT